MLWSIYWSQTEQHEAVLAMNIQQAAWIATPDTNVKMTKEDALMFNRK